MGVDFGTARELGLSSIDDDYEVYGMLCYEDNEWIGCINLHLAPRDRETEQHALRFGRSPEECRRRFLRPEQDAFFRKHLPDVYARFASG